MVAVIVRGAMSPALRFSRSGVTAIIIITIIAHSVPAISASSRIASRRGSFSRAANSGAAAAPDFTLRAM